MSILTVYPEAVPRLQLGKLEPTSSRNEVLDPPLLPRDRGQRARLTSSTQLKTLVEIIIFWGLDQLVKSILPESCAEDIERYYCNQTITVAEHR